VGFHGGPVSTAMTASSAATRSRCSRRYAAATWARYAGNSRAATTAAFSLTPRRRTSLANQESSRSFRAWCALTSRRAAANADTITEVDGGEGKPAPRKATTATRRASCPASSSCSSSLPPAVTQGSSHRARAARTSVARTTRPPGTSINRGGAQQPPVIAALRDLTRYRKKIVQERTRETHRVQKLLEDAGIKLDSVVSDVLGHSARQMMEGLIAGVDDPTVLAELARTSCAERSASCAWRWRVASAPTTP
jgi:hypothetical protein